MSELDAIIIGSGASAYSVADWLHKYGIVNIAIVTEGKNCGTSRNTGSDKQTYYKLSLDYNSRDSVSKMTKTYFNGGACDGDMALSEAVNSVRCFMRLVEYGVPFPTDDYGAFIGYKTDHDPMNRATSIGPLTSKSMTERLEDKVLNFNKTTLLDNLLVFKIIVNNDNAVGVLAYNITTQKVISIKAKNVIVATGAPARIYKNSVYPRSQNGMTGMIIKTGAKMSNFSEWQYGIASIKFRWNLSGSYQQAIPRYISVDKDDNQREFLLDYYQNNEVYNNVFLKGYQWPFDVKKTNGSSMIDLLVQKEILKGNRVYLDFTSEPQGLNLCQLSTLATEYLSKSNALVDTPIARLLALNPNAVNLYKSNNIDLKKEWLEIGICAQHNNGGVYVDNNRQTSIPHLFAVGEVAGNFGIYRPGGAALNSTQVGGLRIAEYLAYQSSPSPEVEDNIFIEAIAKIEEQFNLAIDKSAQNYDIMKIVAKKMSDVAGISRDRDKILELIELIKEYTTILEEVKITDYSAIPTLLRDKDALVSALVLCESIVGTMDQCGSRGGALYLVKGKTVKENVKYRRYISIYKDNAVTMQKRNPLPSYQNWFETDWEKFKNKTKK